MKFEQQIWDVIQVHLKPYAFLWTKSYEDADDLMQETLIKAYKNRDKFNGGNLQGWLYVMMKGKFVDSTRKVWRKREVLDVEIYDTRESTCDELIKKEMMEECQKIRSNWREVLMLSYEGYNGKEIAEKLKTTPSNVNRMLFKARQQLQSILGFTKTFKGQYGT